MDQKNSRNTKGKIISAAWSLFYDKGYESTTIDEIIALSGTSKGSFYHYFDGKEALIGTLAYLFDEKYEKLQDRLSAYDSCYDKLIFLNQELFSLIENSIPLDLLARLMSDQLFPQGEKNLLDHSRLYYRLLMKIFQEGEKNGEFRTDLSAIEMVKIYAVAERALLYDWCICNGEYSLKTYAASAMPIYIGKLLK